MSLLRTGRAGGPPAETTGVGIGSSFSTLFFRILATVYASWASTFLVLAVSYCSSAFKFSARARAYACSGLSPLAMSSWGTA